MGPVVSAICGIIEGRIVDGFGAAAMVIAGLALMVAGCAALVSETGGLLDHGAALARELGIPCVVGCRDAWSLLSDGMLVTVDGDGGLVTTQSSSS
jgi:pyruvate,water dikinase